MIFRRLLCCLLLLICVGSAGAQDQTELAWKTRANLAAGHWDQARAGLEALARGHHGAADPFEQAFAARALAEGARRFQGRDSRLADQSYRAAAERLKSFEGWLSEYPNLIDVHGFQEPAWIHGQAEAVSQAILAWCELTELDKETGRRELVEKFCEGLLALDRKDSSRYPFGAHTSFAAIGRGYVPVEGGPDASGAEWVTSRAYQVAALARAGQLYNRSEWLAAAEKEALGMTAHLVVADRPVLGFAPRPMATIDPLAAAALVENLVAVYQASGKDVYAVLAGIGGIWVRHPEVSKRPEAVDLLKAAVANLPGDRYQNGADVGRPSAYQVMDAERGRAVKKAFDIQDITYPDGEAGQIVTVGREQMFWMRFDVDREDDYFFYMIFLKSEVGGGLVSVMMRIDGDKIFQVNLGGASGVPFMDIELVEGPRHLRQGPHSFGIRFSGLLMTRPAVLDAVVVQPVLERRTLDLPGGRRMIVLKNMATTPARTTYEEVHPWPASRIEVVDGTGQTAQLSYETDPRRRKDYLVVPAGGVAILEWTPGPGTE
ncbi:MAG: hypothetical protein AB7S38_06510 [Vulcanimicrobiota bacterium]